MQPDRDILLAPIPEGTPTPSAASPEQPAEQPSLPPEQQRPPSPPTTFAPQMSTPPDKGAALSAAAQPSPSSSATPDTAGADRPRRLRDWMSPRRRASEPGEGWAKRAPTASPKLLFSRIRDKFVRRRSSRKSEADEQQEPLPQLPYSSPGSLAAVHHTRAGLFDDCQAAAASPEGASSPDERSFCAAPALVGTLPDSPPLPALPTSDSAQAAQPALARADAPLAALLPPSPDIRSHALQLSEASLQDDSPPPGQLQHGPHADDADTASSLQQPDNTGAEAPDPETPASVRHSDAQASAQPGSLAGATAPAEASTPTGQLSTAVTPFFSAQSNWTGPRELHTVPSGLFTPRAQNGPAGSHSAGSLSAGNPMRSSLPMSENPLYGQRSEPQSARGFKHLQTSASVGLEQLFPTPERTASPALATQASIRAADAAARQLTHRASGLSSLLEPHTHSLGSLPAQEPVLHAGPEPEPADGSLTARGRALHRLKSRNLSRAYQSGPLSARSA